jgi:hypothetical protein
MGLNSFECRRHAAPLSFDETNPSDDRSMSKIGRPSKGPRDAVTAKPPLPFGAILRENAKKMGLPYGEYLVLLAAERLDMLEYAPAAARERANAIDFPEEAGTAAA